MKITIDTKEDSPDDIRRVLKMLEAWVGGQTNAPMDMFSSGSGSGSGDAGTPMGIFNIFNDDKKDSSPGSSTMMPEEPKKDDEVPQIIAYM